MRRSTRLPAAALPCVALLLALSLAGCSSSGTASSGAVDPLSVVTGQPIPTEEAPLPSLSTVPDPGTVTLAAGPFNDRFTLDGLGLAAGVVTGTLSITSDVSDLINLTVRADFYDGAGVLVGSDRQVDGVAETEAFHSERGVQGLPLRLAGPPTASSVLLTVPVLVNE